LATEQFDLTPDAERTIECNPGTLTDEKIQGIVELGFNRVSLGSQSFIERELKFLNRAHSVEEIHSAVERFKKAGIGNFNLDLIFGIPAQSLSDFEYNLKSAIALEPTHLSVYGLTIEEGTPLFSAHKMGEFKKVHDELYEALFLTTHAVLGRNGFVHYEISNYAKPNFESRHNMNCWRGSDYLGFGPSAHSRVGLKRWANGTTLDSYTTFPLRKTFSHHLSTEQVRLERLMLSLRTHEGLACSVGKSDRVDRLKRNRLIHQSKDRLMLTPEGMLLIDEIILLLEEDPCLTLN